MWGWWLRWWRCQRIGGTLEGGRLVEHVPAIARIAQLPGGLGELLRALAVDGGSADGEGLGHGVKLSRGLRFGGLVCGPDLGANLRHVVVVHLRLLGDGLHHLREIFALAFGAFGAFVGQLKLFG